MIVAIVQARMSSTRLPGKVLRLINHKPLLFYIVERLKESKLIDRIVIATSSNKNDDKIQFWAEENKLPFFRGDENDVLKRFYDAALESKASVIVRITADDPFKDPKLIDSAIKLLIDEKLDFVCNNYPPSFPEGLDVEVFTFSLLRRAFLNANSDFEREHVTQYFFKNLDKINMGVIKNDIDISFHRWTIDTLNDFLFVQEVYKCLYEKNKIFTTQQILDLITEKPEIPKINNNENRSFMYKNNDNEKI